VKDWPRGWALVALVVMMMIGCAPAAPSGTTGRPAGNVENRPNRALNSVMKVEPTSLAAKPLRNTGTSVAHGVRLFNAGLAIESSREQPQPYLAEGLPQLNTDSWQVLPDGRMETTWRLKPDLTWHDGTPLSTEDFVFAYRVYANPANGVAGSPPINQIADVVAIDDRTVAIHWKRPYPDGGRLGADSLQPLPRHILEQPLQQLDPEGFANHPYWGAEYVGLGPYRLERWEPGAYIEGAAFDRHVLGRPKIDRVVVRFIADENTGLTNVLAGEIQLVTDRTIRFEQAMVLQREWGQSGGGTVIATPNQPRFIFFQHRPEYMNPSSLTDVRVRRAIAHAVDKDGLNEGLFDGQGIMSNTHVTPQAPIFPEVDRAINKYPYDPRRTEALLVEAGYSKGADGVFVSAGGERLTPGLVAETVGQFQREANILAATWRAAGIDVGITGLPSTQLRDGPARATFPAILSASASAALKGGTTNFGNFSTPAIRSESNAWRGSNFGGYANPEFDRLWTAFNSTLDPAERDRQAIEMARMISVDLPLVDLYWNPNITAHVASLQGLDPQAIDHLVNWNVHEWTLR
jgi:peptide/nickel transport system substrate-binding protein